MKEPAITGLIVVTCSLFLAHRPDCRSAANFKWPACLQKRSQLFRHAFEVTGYKYSS